MDLIMSVASIGAVIWAMIQLEIAMICRPQLLLTAIEGCRLALVATILLCLAGLVLAYIGAFPQLYSPLIDFTLAPALATTLGFVAYCCKPALNDRIVSFMAFMLGVSAVMLVALRAIDYLAPLFMGCVYGSILLLGMHKGKVRWQRFVLQHEQRRMSRLSTCSTASPTA